MIIFGTSSKVIQLAMLNLLCGFCGNPSAHALRKRVLRFSLFFIPLFPVAPAKHSLQCTFCGAQSEVSKENAEQLLQQGGQGPQSAAPGQHPPQSSPFAGQGGHGNPYQQQPPHNPYQS